MLGHLVGAGFGFDLSGINFVSETELGIRLHRPDGDYGAPDDRVRRAPARALHRSANNGILHVTIHMAYKLIETHLGTKDLG